MSGDEFKGVPLDEALDLIEKRHRRYLNDCYNVHGRLNFIRSRPHDTTVANSPARFVGLTDDEINALEVALYRAWSGTKSGEPL